MVAAKSTEQNTVLVDNLDVFKTAIANTADSMQKSKSWNPLHEIIRVGVPDGLIQGREDTSTHISGCRSTTSPM